jgi:ribosome-associated translation inhibitor RaiA
MKHEIESYFEPEITWLGEINRRVLQLEREVNVFPPRHTHLHCALWRGREDRAGLTLTLSIGDVELYSRAEDSSPVIATRRAFDELHHQLAKYMSEFQDKDIRLRANFNRRAPDTLSGIRPELTAPYMTHSSLAPSHN